MNWLQLDDPDVERALWFIDRTPDPMVSRQLVELRARSLLSTRWPAVLTLADALDRSPILVGPQVEELLRGFAASNGAKVDPSTLVLGIIDFPLVFGP